MSQSLNLKTLEALLTFNPKTEDIFSVEGRMRAILEIYKDNPEYRFLADFLKIYHLVTQKVVDSRFESAKYFKNVDELNRLDVVFADYYFKAAKKYLFKGTTIQPWVNTFNLGPDCRVAFINALMGINSHINGDLACALLDMNFKTEDDFNKVNSVLLAVLPGVFSYLAFERLDMFGTVGIIAKSFVENEFNTLIVKWRQDAYSNYLKLKNSKEKQNHVNLIRVQTEEVSEKIYNIFKNNLINPPALIKQLHTLEVKI